MTDQSKYPERIWASYRKQPEQLYAYPWKSWEGNHRETEFVRSDIYDALTKERDELQAEVERVREASWPDDPDTEIDGYTAFTAPDGSVWVHSSSVDNRRALVAEIARLTAERDDWAYKFNESCNTYSQMHVALEEAQDERDQALAANERWRRNSTETWEAMTAMRNEINHHIPMPSIESDLLQGPENSIFCASVAEAVISGIQARAAAAAMEMREAAADEACYACGSQDIIRALPIDPDAQKALDKLLARTRVDAIREAAELAAAGHHPRAILALITDGDSNDTD